MDRSAFDWDRIGQQEQGADSLALVHSLLLPRGGRQHLRSRLPVAYPVLKHLVIGLTVTLYLIGTGLSMKTLREVGVRPFLQGVLLWLFVATGSLALIRRLDSPVAVPRQLSSLLSVLARHIWPVILPDTRLKPNGR